MRELEQVNDDFERSVRAVQMTLSTTEVEFNHRIEAFALLQTDLEDHQGQIQHLKEEIRGKSDLGDSGVWESCSQFMYSL